MTGDLHICIWICWSCFCQLHVWTICLSAAAAMWRQILRLPLKCRPRREVLSESPAPILSPSLRLAVPGLRPTWQSPATEGRGRECWCVPAEQHRLPACCFCCRCCWTPSTEHANTRWLWKSRGSVSPALHCCCCWILEIVCGFTCSGCTSRVSPAHCGEHRVAKFDRF